MSSKANKSEIFQAAFLFVTLWTVTFSCSTINQTGDCKSGWFGSRCQYKCRCENDACISRNNGACQPWSKCRRGWFGPECQYVDLAHNLNSIATDGNDWSCITRSTSFITTDLNRSVHGDYHFTWMRIRISEPWTVFFLNTFRAELKSDKRSISCLNQRRFTVDKQTLDVYCDIPEPVYSVTIYGGAVSCLCSVYVSGGRNLALGQTASQSRSASDNQLQEVCSTGDCFNSSCAVDGDTSDLNRESCSYTKLRVQPTLTINFTIPIKPTRSVIYYNNKDSNLQSFTVEKYDINHTKLSDGNKANIRISRIWSSSTSQMNQEISSIVIKPDVNTEGDYTMSICELEVYGEYSCPAGRYGKECQSSCHCAHNSSCLVSTGLCPAGCSAGYQGDTCSQACQRNRYGSNCTQECSQFCEGSRSTSSVCHHINGSCFSGCQSGYELPQCVATCGKDKYGPNCSSQCSVNCVRKTTTLSSCNRTTGQCFDGCRDGYLGDKCDTACDSHKYGAGCNSTCNQNCQTHMDGSICNNTNGHCLHGCRDGWQGEQCEQECDTGKYGKSCSLSCSDFCVPINDVWATTCNHVTGNCLYGCLSGYLNPHCVVKLSANRDDNTSTFVGVSAVLGTAIIILFILLYVIYRRGRSNGGDALSGIAMKDKGIGNIYSPQFDNLTAARG